MALLKPRCTEPQAKSLSYGDLVERIVAVSIECEAKWWESWEANDGIVGFRKAALARSAILPDRSDKKGQRNADRATRGRGDLGRSIHVGVVASGDHAKLPRYKASSLRT